MKNISQPAFVFDESSLKQLHQPGAYRHPVSVISQMETHISWILLTGSFVYKIKRPVNLEFLDFSTLRKRKYFCEEEVRLNHRFAPELYIGIVPITNDNGQLAFDGVGEVVEYAVKMRQFDNHYLLKNIASEGRFSHKLARQLGQHVARIHQRLPRHIISQEKRMYSSGTPLTLFMAMKQNFTQIRPYLNKASDLSMLEKISEWCWHERDALLALLWRRLNEGFVRECHGDLHLGNVALVDEKITLFDCIEFNREFRLVDVMRELAMLEMDIDSSDLSECGNTVLNAYFEVSGDYAGLRLLNFYRVYAALIRAKVTLLATGSPSGKTDQPSEQYFSYVALINHYMQRHASRPRLLLMCGLSGSGKSTVGAHLARVTNGLIIRSDVERQRLLGQAPNPSGLPVLSVGEPYSAAVTQQTYLRLQSLVPQIIDAGFDCIVDATFSTRARRDEFLALAEELQVPLILVYCHASVAELERRIQRRSERGDDPSEATVDVLKGQLDCFEYPSSEESHAYLSIDTAQRDWQQQVESSLAGTVTE